MYSVLHKTNAAMAAVEYHFIKYRVIQMYHDSTGAIKYICMTLYKKVYRCLVVQIDVIIKIRKRSRLVGMFRTIPSFNEMVFHDGSLDESKCICKKMCSTDHRIRFISQEHKGVSAARNAALEIAAGEYLFFLDS